MAVRLQIGSNAAFKNEVQVMLDVPPRIVNDRTLVPLRFVSEALGAQVGWDGAADGSYTFEIEPQPVLGKHVYAADFTWR
ncbi:MAG: copper amine oxidase N-terminal domain-containing protein, partial [Eubacteriales bacterium]